MRNDGPQDGTEFSGKVILVTGAGRGMGRGIAEAFVRQSATVVVGARSRTSGLAAVDQLSRLGPGKAELGLADMTRRDDIFGLVQSIAERHGRLDAVVHCAADVPAAPVLDISEAEVDRMLGTVIKASTWLIQAAAPTMIAQGGGRIILFSSICGPRLAIPGLCLYGAAKAGLNALIAGAALELAAHRITVTGVEPGITDTDNVRASMSDAQIGELAGKVPAGRIARIDDMARATLFLAGDRSDYITGTTIRVDGGLSLHAAGFPLADDRPR